MAKEKKKTAVEERMELNMTPMIDIVFLLIIFFMLVTEVSKMDLRTAVQLPIADQANVKAMKDPDRVVINVEFSESGKPRIFFKNKPVNWAGLKHHLHVAASLTRDRTGTPINGIYPSKAHVLIRADKRIQYQYVQQIMMMCAEERIWKISLVAKKVGENHGA